jgi:hypothetical protein
VIISNFDLPSQTVTISFTLVELTSHCFPKSRQAKTQTPTAENFPMSLTNALPADVAKAAKTASHVLANLPAASRNDALTAIHSALNNAKADILEANAQDLVLAKKAAEDGEMSLSIVSRLDLGKKGKWEDMLKGILDVRDLEDPGL